MLDLPLSREWLLRQFGGEDTVARAAYRRFVRAGIAKPARPWDDLRAGLVLGGDAFLGSVRRHLADAPAEAPKPQRHLARLPLRELVDAGTDRGAWMTDAHDTHGKTLAEIADAAGLRPSA